MISWPYQVSGLISQNIRTVDTASDWVTATLGMVDTSRDNQRYFFFQLPN